MKKFLVFIVCMLIVCAFPFSVYAEGATESAITAPEKITEENTGGNSDHGIAELLSVKFKEWVVPHIEEISVIITLIGTAFYNMRKHKLLNKSMGVMNNNTIAIAEQSSSMMNQALTGMENVSNIVTAYDERIAALLEAHEATAKKNEELEAELAELKIYLKSSSESNIEFANELAELLNLANIPNFKKQEIGARHIASVKSIRAAEQEALNTVRGLNTTNKEAVNNDGEKA